MKKYIPPTNPKKSNTKQPDKLNPTKPKKEKKVKSTNHKQKIYKSQKVTPTKNNNIKDLFVRKNDTPKERKHADYGTSKLEEKFAKNFLEKLNIEFDYQFKAESIGRYYDFYLPTINIIIEINGGYWHSDPRLYEGKELTPTQKKNKRVDKLKKKWADEHKIPIYYFWEDDINKNPKLVLEQLKELIIKETKNYQLKENKKNRPNY